VFTASSIDLSLYPVLNGYCGEFFFFINCGQIVCRKPFTYLRKNFFLEKTIQIITLVSVNVIGTDEVFNRKEVI
jgi:hypothetical protein